MVDRLRTLVSFGLWCAAFFLGPAGFLFVATAGESPLADERCWFDAHNHLYTNVYLNGEGPFPFIVDTAATISAVFAPVAGRLDTAKRPDGGTVEGTPGRRMVYTLLGRQERETFELDRLRFGAIERRDVTVIAMPNWRKSDGNPAGVLGLDFLSDYLTVFRLGPDCRLSAYAAGTKLEHTQKWRTTRLHPKRIRETGATLWFLRPNIGYRGGNRHVTGLFDLGSNATIVNIPAMRRIGLGRAIEKSGASIGDPSGQISVAFQLKNLPIRFAGKARKQDVLGGDLPIFALLGYGDTAAAIIGIDIFHGLEFAVDFERRRVLVAPVVME